MEATAALLGDSPLANQDGREPVGNGQAAAGFSEDFRPGAAAVDGVAGAGAGLVAAFFAAGFFAAGFLAAGFFAAGFLAAGFFAAGLAATTGFAAGAAGRGAGAPISGLAGIVGEMGLIGLNGDLWSMGSPCCVVVKTNA